MNGKIMKFFVLSILSTLFVPPVCAIEKEASVMGASGAYELILIACCVCLLGVIALISGKLAKMKKRVEKSFMTDADTGAGNLAYFENCFNTDITDEMRSRYSLLFLMIDSNYLSVYHGDDAFDRAVKYVADALKNIERKGEFSARIAENGFAFAVCTADKSSAEQRAKEMLESLNLFLGTENESNRPYFHAALYRLNHEDKNCGVLLYNLRKNCNRLQNSETQLLICDDNMMENAVQEELFIDKIEKAFEEEEFKLYLQFIVDNKTKKITFAEALSRWEDKNGDIIMPGKYLGVMERNGMITKLDYYMFERVCKQLAAWRDTEFGHLMISCNFTRITISGKSFISKIKSIADAYDFDRKNLLIEITEDTVEHNMDVAMQNIKQMKELGFRIALDDMGSGYTSLINLCEYPLDVVKIDRDILLRIDKDNGKDLFVGIIFLAHSLNLEVVCEGVETETQNTMVSETACDYIQGWYYSRAMSIPNAEAFAREYEEKLA